MTEITTGSKATIKIGDETFTGIITLVENGFYIVCYSPDNERVEFEMIKI